MSSGRWIGVSLLLAACTAGVQGQTDIPRPIGPSPTAPDTPSSPTPADKWGPPLPDDIKLFENTAFGECMKCNRLRVFGWADSGYTYSSTGHDPLTVQPRENRFGDEFLVNQLAVVIERQLDPEKLSFGFNATYYAGADASLLQPKGGIDDPPRDPRFSHDFRQLYVSAHLPMLTEGGVDVKAGRMGTIIGYNSALAPYRPLYSSDYQWFYSQDGAFTGILANWHVNKQLDVLSGVTLGANTFYTKRSDSSYCYIGQVNYWLTEEKKTLISASTYVGENAIFAAPGLAGDYDYTFEVRLQHNWSKYLDQIVQSDFGWDRNTPRGTAAFYGIYNIFSTHLSCKLDLNLRTEYYRDEKGTRTGFDAHYGESTLGFDYHPCKFLRIRPEVRGDFADTRVFDNGNRRSQFTAAIDWLIQF